MLTFVELPQNWNSLGVILAQPGFDPAVFRLEMDAKGFPHGFFKKNLLRDIMCALTMFSSRETRCMSYVYPCTFDSKTKSGDPVCGSCKSTEDAAEALAGLVDATPYFDKWLARWRVMCREEFAGFVEDSLRAWNGGGEFDYVKCYSPKRHTEYLEKLRPAMDGIIKKTKTLM